MTRLVALCLLIVALAIAAPGRRSALSLMAQDQTESRTVSADASADEQTATAGKASGNDEDEVEKVLVSGEILFLPEALRRKKVKTYSEEIASQIVLLTNEGALVPIVPDWRGRAFYQDERLRGRSVDLIANRRPGVPWVSVLSIYVFDEKGQRNVADYWCDVCSIPMYEIKECECCQGPTRLRLRPQALPKDARPVTGK